LCRETNEYIQGRTCAFGMKVRSNVVDGGIELVNEERLT
jgi:hypothetical protein